MALAEEEYEAAQIAYMAAHEAMQKAWERLRDAVRALPKVPAGQRAVGRMGLSGNLHVDERPTDAAIAEQAAMTEAYYADPDV